MLNVMQQLRLDIRKRIGTKNIKSVKVKRATFTKLLVIDEIGCLPFSQ
jgi:DNA replication protein DnaC